MGIQCVIFDCDGTLVDSERLGMKLLVQMVAEHGIALDLVETSETFAGVRLAKTVETIEQRFDKALPTGFIPEYRVRLHDRIKLHLRAMPGVRDSLKKIDLPCCVASNAPLEKIRLCLATAALSEFFDDKIYSAYELGTWKPDPGLFLAAARGMGFKPADCVVVEDSMPGIHSGLEAGTSVIAYRQPGIDDPGVKHLDHHRDLAGLVDSLR